MQMNRRAFRGRSIMAVPAIIAGIVLVALLRRPLIRLAALISGAAIVAFLAEPVCRLMEKKLSRRAAALAGLSMIVLCLFAVLWMLLPAMLRQLADLSKSLPEIVEGFSGWMERASLWLNERVPGLSLPDIGLNGLESLLSGLAAGTLSAAMNVAEMVAMVSLMVVLAYFLLRDRDVLLLKLELLVPQSIRHAAVGLGNCVCREFRLYLRGQLLIALAVAALASAGLAVIHVRGALVLGPIIGLLNMIPYFGPYIGGLPSVLIALGDGWKKALMAVAVLAAVQQIDGTLISPRILGSLTGLSPGLVLVGIFAGAQVAGVPGMLFAVPTMMLFRTLYRFCVQRMEKKNENI